MAELGNKRKIYVGAASGSTFTWLTGEQSNNFTLNNNAVEVSDKSSEYQDFVGGIKGGSGSATVFADDTDAQQKALIDSIQNGTKVKIFVGTLSSSSAPEKGWSFDAIVTSVADTNDNGSVSTRDFSYNTCGAVTHHPGA